MIRSFCASYLPVRQTRTVPSPTGAVRPTTRSECLSHPSTVAKSIRTYGDYSKAAWLKKHQPAGEVKNRELTEEEKKAYLARREKRLEQIQIQKQLNKSFRNEDMKTVWALHDRLAHRDQWTYNQMIAVAAKGGFVQKAFSIYQKMKKVPLKPSLATYHWLLQACANGEGDGAYLARAFYVMEQMKEQNLKLNLHAYNLILQVCSNAKDTETAAQILQKMQSDGIAPDISSLTTLLTCASGSDISSINRIWKELTSTFQPDIRAWNTYLKVLKDSGHSKELLEAFNEMITPQSNKTNGNDSSTNQSTKTPIRSESMSELPTEIPNSYSLSLVLDACSEAKLFREGTVIMNKIMTTWRKSVELDEVLAQSMLRIASRARTSNEINQILEFMEHKKVPISKSTRELLIMAYGRTGDMKQTLWHFEAARSEAQLNTRCFTGLLIACRTVSDPERAYLSFEVMRKAKLIADEVYLRLLKEVLVSNRRSDLWKKVELSLNEANSTRTSNAKDHTADSEHADTMKKYEYYRGNEFSDIRKEKPVHQNEIEQQEQYSEEEPTHHQKPQKTYASGSNLAHRFKEGEVPKMARLGKIPVTTILPNSRSPATSSTTVKKMPSNQVILPTQAPKASGSAFFAPERISESLRDLELNKL